MSSRSTYSLVLAGICVVVVLVWLVGHAGPPRGPGLTDGPAGVNGRGSTGTSDHGSPTADAAAGSLRETGGDDPASGAGSAADRGPTGGAAGAASKSVSSAGSGKTTASAAGAGPAADSTASPDAAALSDQNVELPMPESGLNDSPEVKAAYEQAVRRACETHFWDMRAACYEEFLQTYPLSKYSPSVMANLAMAYAEMDRVDDARHTLEGAKLLAGNDPITNFLDVMLADMDIRGQKFSQAEAKLQAVMKRPIPGSLESEYAVAGPKLLAPIRLAGVLAAQGHVDEADRLLTETCRTALDWTRTHSNVEWLPSYATYASYERVRLALDIRGPDDAAPILAQVRQYLPDLEGKQGYGRVLELLALADYSRASTRTGSGKAPAEVEGG